MPIYSFEGKTPRVHPTAFVAPTASVVGDVVIEEGASVWYGAVLRGDIAPIVIGRGANVQDCAVLHGNPENGILVGPGVTIGHLAMVHAATLGEECVIGNAATVLDGAVIGPRAMVGAGAVVTPHGTVPEGMLAVGVPAKLRGPLAGTQAEEIVRHNPAAYQAMAQRHRTGIKEQA